MLDIGALYRQFQSVPDSRKRRGRRYPLAVLLTIAVLAKLAGASGVRALADWAKLRSQEFADLFDLPRPSMPHATTWTRVFGHAALVEAVEQAVATLTAPPASGEVPARGSIIINLDGKALRGTIPLGQSAGVHLLAAYQVDVGSVRAQVAVDRKTNEIGAAPAVLRQLKLTGAVVTGDAMFAQRELSTQIVEGGGDYFWWVKDNQPGLHSDLTLLFDRECVAAGWSAPPVDFTWAATIEKGHARLEMRVLTASSMLAGYSDWPYLAQAVKVERTRITKLKREQEVAFGITSLPAPAADAAMGCTIGAT
jgi:predicted transposase YbfD/YdcC